MMQETVVIHGKLWLNRSISKVPGLRENCAINMAFYDQKTGTVWGTRTYTGAEESVWHYSPRDPRLMDATFPFEWNQDCVPNELLAAVLVGLVNNPPQLSQINPHN
jgi:hypothetical protein